MLALLGSLNMLIFLYLVFGVCLGTHPGKALLMFLGVTMLSCMVLYKSLTTFLPFMQFLVYVGGLLVLMLYMIMLSSITKKESSSQAFYVGFVLWLFLMGGSPPDEGGGPNIGQTLFLDFSMYVTMAIMLTMCFMFICQMISCGGRTMNIGKIS